MVRAPRVAESEGREKEYFKLFFFKVCNFCRGRSLLLLAPRH